MPKPNRLEGRYLTPDQAKVFRQLPHFEGDYRAAFTDKQYRAWSRFVSWGLVASKVEGKKRTFTRTPEGTAELLAYHVEYELRDRHAEFVSPQYAHREPLL